MHTPLPPIHETAEELQGLLKAAREAQQPQGLQALSCRQTPQARTRPQVAPRLGVSRTTVRRWRAADEPGGRAQGVTVAKAPGKGPRVSPALQAARRQRLAPPAGFARDKALWPWRQHDYGLARA